MLLRPHQCVRGRWPWGYGSVLSIIITVVLVIIIPLMVLEVCVVMGCTASTVEFLTISLEAQLRRKLEGMQKYVIHIMCYLYLRYPLLVCVYVCVCVCVCVSLSVRVFLWL